MALTEEEQLQVFKTWWQENGRQTLLGLVVILAAYAGWTQWQNSQHAKQEAASVLYETWLEAKGNAGSAAASDAITQLREQYSSTFYGQAALLFLAQENVDQGKLEEAETQLNTLIEQKPTDDLFFTARLRSAKVLFSLEKNDAAIARLKAPVVEGFRVPFSELRGDIYMAEGKIEKARTAYQDAMEALGEQSAQNDALRMKLKNAQGTPIVTQVSGE